MNRRQFLQKTTAAGVALGVPAIVPASVLGRAAKGKSRSGVPAPSDRVTVGLIGTGRQGSGNNLQGADLKALGTRILGLLDVPEAQVVAACDVDSWRLNRAKTTVETT